MHYVQSELKSNVNYLTLLIIQEVEASLFSKKLNWLVAMLKMHGLSKREATFRPKRGG